MHFRTAATILVGAALMHGCADAPDRGGPGTTGGGGRPGPFAHVQHLQPVTIEGVKPVADPKERFSIAICAQTPCNFTVTVDASCNITLDPQYMGLRYASPSDDFTLVYKLQSSNGHQFAQNTPIDWKKLGGNKPDVDLKSPQEAWVTLKNAQQARRFLYGIVVEDANHVQCGELDPGVIPDL